MTHHPVTCGGSSLASMPVPYTFEALGRVRSQTNSQVQADSRGATSNQHYCAVHGQGH